VIERGEGGALSTGCHVGAPEVRYDIDPDPRGEPRAIADLHGYTVGRRV
jgi:hypothetical protein